MLYLLRHLHSTLIIALSIMPRIGFVRFAHCIPSRLCRATRSRGHGRPRLSEPLSKYAPVHFVTPMHFSSLLPRLFPLVSILLSLSVTPYLLRGLLGSVCLLADFIFSATGRRQWPSRSENQNLSRKFYCPPEQSPSSSPLFSFYFFAFPLSSLLSPLHIPILLSPVMPYLLRHLLSRTQNMRKSIQFVCFYDRERDCGHDCLVFSQNVICFTTQCGTFS